MNPPKQVTGSTTAAAWLNQLLGFALSSRVLGIQGFKARFRPDGMFFEPDQQAGGGRSSTAVKPVTIFRVKTFTAQDTFTAVEWDGTTEGSTTFTIAKLSNFRRSLTSEVVDGVTITHSYADSNNRTSNDGTFLQHEVLWPRLALNAIVVAAKSSNGTGLTSVEWIDLTPRVWLAID